MSVSAFQSWVKGDGFLKVCEEALKWWKDNFPEEARLSVLDMKQQRERLFDPRTARWKETGEGMSQGCIPPRVMNYISMACGHADYDDPDHWIPDNTWSLDRRNLVLFFHAYDAFALNADA